MKARRWKSPRSGLRLQRCLLPCWGSPGARIPLCWLWLSAWGSGRLDPVCGLILFPSGSTRLILQEVALNRL